MSTIVEKIFSKKVGREVHSNEIVTVDVDACMVHDVNGPATVRQFRQIAGKVKSPRKMLFVLDHMAPCPNDRIATQHKELRAFTKEHGIDLADVCQGICHQVMMESGKVLPGSLAVATDSHTCSYGALNLFSTGIGAMEAAIILASDQCWFKVPETIRVEFDGKIPANICGKDLALEMLRVIGPGGANYKCLEFGGSAITELSMDGRIAICNMSAEVGAKGAIMPYDALTAQWMTEHGLSGGEPVCADADAQYADVIRIDVSKLSPMVSVPPEICDARPVSELEKIPIDQVFLGSCTNGRYEDFAVAADILRGKQIAPGIRMLISPASPTVMSRLRKDGILDVLTDAGAILLPSSCGPCAGLHMGLLGDGETALATSNRNLTGRMGSKKARIYISSPLVAAYTALNGFITDGGSEK